MNRLLLSLPVLVVLFIAACRSEDEPKPVVAIPLLVDSITYSAYTWYLDHNTNEHKFYIGHHIRIDKKGMYVAMKRNNFLSKPLYLTGKMNDSLRLQLDTILSKNKFDSLYKILPEPGHQYIGYYYHLNYYQQQQSKEIAYIPPAAPAALMNITNLLDTLIFNTKTHTLDTLHLNDYSLQLESKSRKIFPPLRKLDTSDKHLDAIRQF